jgi:hypothetical protein
MAQPTLTATVFGRAVYRMELGGKTVPVYFHDATPLAVCGLMAAPNSHKMLDSFFEAGGVRAIVQLLRESNSAVTIAQTADFVTGTISYDPQRKRPTRGRELADALHQSGICSISNNNYSYYNYLLLVSRPETG